MVSQSREILQTFVWCGAQTCKNRNFLLSLSIASMVQRVSIKVGWSQKETKELLFPKRYLFATPKRTTCVNIYFARQKLYSTLKKAPQMQMCLRSFFVHDCT